MGLARILAQLGKRSCRRTFQRIVLSGRPLIPIASEKAEQYGPSSVRCETALKTGKKKNREMGNTCYPAILLDPAI